MMTFRNTCFMIGVTAVALASTAMAQGRSALIVSTKLGELNPVNNKIKVDAQGNMAFKDSMGDVQKLRRFECSYIYTPRTKAVAMAEEAFRALNFEQTIAAADAVSTDTRWLGWGAFVGYLKAQALMQLGKLPEAQAEAKEASKYAKQEKRERLLASLAAEIKYLHSGGTPSNKPSVLNHKLQGLAYEKEGKLKEAALEYMKCTYLYPARDNDGEVDMIRMTAMARLSTVLNKARDRASAGAIAAQLKSER